MAVGRYIIMAAKSGSALDASKAWRRMEVRLPIIAAAFILLAAVGTAQFAIYWQSQDVAQRTAVLGAVYLDNLSANVVPSVVAQDVTGVSLALERTLSYYEGIRDQSLFLFDNDGVLVAQARRDESPGVTNIPTAVFAKPSGTIETESDDTAWVWRPLVNESQQLGTLIAALDVSRLHQGRQSLTFYVMLAGLAVSALAGVVGMWLIRQQLKPISTVSKHLEQVAHGRLIEIPDTEPSNEALSALRRAFNEMIVATREREAMVAQLAEQDRAAVLGRLAATIVHEVKNPLGGMQTAVETVKKYGEDPAVRSEALGLIERGLETVSQVIDATLETYKVPETRRALSEDDLTDIATLIRAEANQRGVRFSTNLHLPSGIAVPAVETRQVLLNLLLNACRAAPRGGMVSLSGHAEGTDVCFEVEDDGPGLDRSLLSVPASHGGWAGAGLGIPVVLRLIEEMRAQFEVESILPTGTRWCISIPLMQGRASP